MERTESLVLSLEDRRSEKARAGLELGAAVRTVTGDSTYFGHVDGVAEADLLRLADGVAAAIKGGRSLPQALQPVVRQAGQEVVVAPAGIAAERKADALRAGDERAREAGKEIVQVTGSYAETGQHVQIATSEGRHVVDERVRVRLGIQAVARRGDTLKTGRKVVGGHAGYELLGDDPGGIGEAAARTAIKLLDAVPAPVGKQAVVVGNGFGGVLFHEATGHGLESDAVEKGASVYAGRVGEAVANPIVTAYDDGRLPGAWGTAGCDDEGTPTQKTCVIEEGRLTSYLYDTARARNAGAISTGNGRRQSFRFPPVPRMTNTYIAPGDATPEEIIAAVKHGVYAVSFAGGQVEPATGEFVFGLSEGYLIENGEITSPIGDATLVGNGLEVLRSIDAVADDLSLETGICGKAGQHVPVGTGQPTVRIRSLTVGGTR